jgi:hypothetical protein
MHDDLLPFRTFPLKSRCLPHAAMTDAWCARRQQICERGRGDPAAPPRNSGPHGTTAKQACSCRFECVRLPRASRCRTSCALTRNPRFCTPTPSLSNPTESNRATTAMLFSVRGPGQVDRDAWLQNPVHIHLAHGLGAGNTQGGWGGVGGAKRQCQSRAAAQVGHGSGVFGPSSPPPPPKVKILSGNCTPPPTPLTALPLSQLCYQWLRLWRVYEETDVRGAAKKGQ